MAAVDIVAGGFLKSQDMNVYPKWLLLLAGTNLLCLLLIPFFVFGGFAPFGTSSSSFVGFVLYLLTNLLWLLPVGCFFGSLSLYANYHERLGVLVAVGGLLLTATDFLLLYANL